MLAHCNAPNSSRLVILLFVVLSLLLLLTSRHRLQLHRLIIQPQQQHGAAVPQHEHAPAAPPQHEHSPAAATPPQQHEHAPPAPEPSPPQDQQQQHENSSSSNKASAVLPHVPVPNCPRLHVLRDGACVDAVPSCQLTAEARHDCVAGPSSCECLAECEAVWHLGVPSSASPPLIPCFVSNSSRLASLDDALDRQWYWYRRDRTVEAGCNPQFVPESFNLAAGDAIVLETTRLTSVTKCDNACNGRGWCMATAPAWASTQPPSCSCFHPWDGPDCSQLSLSTLHHSNTCLNDCNGRGVCQQGVCMCNSSSWGVDCSLPLLHEAEAADIYVYELPPGFNSWWGSTPGRDLGRALHAALLRSPHRTADPEKASVFWVPVEPIGLVSTGQALLALDYVRQTYPYYNRSQGRDHAIAYGWDSGSCWIAKHPLAVDTIQVSHFGLQQADDKMICRCKLCGPGFTLLVPDTMEQHYKRMSPLHYGQPDTTPRPIWLFFAGSVSGAERAALAAVISNATFRASVPAFKPRGGIHIRVGEHLVGDTNATSLGDGMRQAQFCLAPPGAGFGTRGTLAVLLGCVPVYIGELRQPWDDVLDYSSFSLRLPVGRLHELLDVVAAADYGALRAGLGRVWHMFSWASLYGPVGGEPLEHDALHMMLAAARRQAKRQQGAAAEGAVVQPFAAAALNTSL